VPEADAGAPRPRGLLARVPPYGLAAGALTLAIVGVSLVLSVNRFARLALNPLAARWIGRVGRRRGTIAGVLLATASTAGYALAPGLAALLVARVAWGAAFATLRLTMYGYATGDAVRAPRRLGIAVGVQELAPAALLVVGAALLGLLGPRWLFALLAALSLLALPLALALPRRTAVAPARSDAPRSAAPVRAGRVVGLRRSAFASATVAFGVDGVTTAGVVLTLLAFGASAVEAATVGAMLLAARKVAQVVVSPLGGLLGERWGVRRVVGGAMVATAAGLAVVAAGGVVAGTLLAVAAGSVVGALTPAGLETPDAAARLRALGWLTSARDLGAACGAAFAPLALLGVGAAGAVAWTFGLTAGAVLLAAAVWAGRPRAHRS
jgi:MFS family permease